MDRATMQIVYNMLDEYRKQVAEDRDMGRPQLDREFMLVDIKAKLEQEENDYLTEMAEYYEMKREDEAAYRAQYDTVEEKNDYYTDDDIPF